MSPAQAPVPLFRIWIAACPDFRPARWDQVPARAVALEPADPGCLAADEAQAFLAGFNGRMLAEAHPLWAVALPVSLRVEGDPRAGESVAAQGFEPAVHWRS